MQFQEKVGHQKPIRRFFLSIFRKKPLAEEAEIAQKLLDSANSALSSSEVRESIEKAGARKIQVRCAQKIFGKGYRLTVDYGFKYALAGIVVEINSIKGAAQLIMRAGRMEEDYFFYSVNKRSAGELAGFERLVLAEIENHSKNLKKYPSKCSDLQKLERFAAGENSAKWPTASFSKATTALGLAFILSLQGCSSSEKPGTDSRQGDKRREIIYMPVKKTDKAEKAESTVLE